MNLSASGTMMTAIGTVVMLLVAACSASAPRCVPGTSTECTCPNSAKGAQVCQPSGTFGACACEPAHANATGVARSEPSAPVVVPAIVVPAPTRDEAISVVREWIEAHRANDRDRLGRVTEETFWQSGADSVSRESCARLATAGRDLLLSCLLKNRLLADTGPRNLDEAPARARRSRDAGRRWHEVDFGYFLIPSPRAWRKHPIPGSQRDAGRMKSLAPTHSFVFVLLGTHHEEGDNGGGSFSLMFAVHRSDVGIPRVAAIMAEVGPDDGDDGDL